MVIKMAVPVIGLLQPMAILLAFLIGFYNTNLPSAVESGFSLSSRSCSLTTQCDNKDL